ncbi:MAG: 2'-5' RNA ligase family protein [Spirochaetales bacterium]|nr:2'-5' RNA ligase family protein [Spirochaetales bacterium]
MSYIDEKQSALLVIAYPQLSDADLKWIDDFRKEYDTLFYGIVEPHFTIVFPTFGISQSQFITEIQDKVKTFKSFDFTIRCAMMTNDPLSSFYYVFLSPDEGNSNIVKLHDACYSGILRSTQRLDIDFYSHIGIGNTNDPVKCKELVDMINNQNRIIKGTVSALHVISYGDRKVTEIEAINLTF